jgi:hypothetical protein
MQKDCKLAASSCGSTCISPKKSCTLRVQSAPLDKLTDTIGSASARLRARIEAKKLEVMAKTNENVLIDYQDPAGVLGKASTRAKNAIKEAFPDLTEAEGAALYQWTSSGYRDFYGRLVNKNPEAKPLVGSLLSAMKKLPAPSKANIQKDDAIMAARIKDDSNIKSYTKAERFMTISDKLKDLNEDTLFKSFSAFSYGYAGLNVFSTGSNVKVVMNHKGESSSGRLVDQAKADLKETEILFPPNFSHKIVQVKVGQSSYPSLAEAKKNPGFNTSKVEIEVDEL